MTEFNTLHKVVSDAIRKRSSKDWGVEHPLDLVFDKDKELDEQDAMHQDAKNTVFRDEVRAIRDSIDNMSQGMNCASKDFVALGNVLTSLFKPVVRDPSSTTPPCHQIALRMYGGEVGQSPLSSTIDDVYGTVQEVYKGLRDTLDVSAGASKEYLIGPEVSPCGR